MNKKSAAISSLLLFLLVFPLLGVTCVQGQAVAVSGLSEGNTFTYDNIYTWTSTNPIESVPLSLIAQNQSTLEITIQTVTGSTVGLGKLWIYKNGTQVPSTEYDEVNSGLTGTVLVYAANLTAGGLLFPGSTELPFVINDTTFRAYGGIFRETNHIEVNNTGIEGMVYSYMNLYFDRATGMCVEYYLTSVYTSNPNQVIVQHLVLKGSNVWQVSSNSGTPTATPSTSPPPSSSQPTSQATLPPDDGSSGFPTSLIIIIVVVAVIVIVAGFLLLPKGKPKPKQEPQEKQEAPKEAPEKEQQPKEESKEDTYSI
jgi:hypothetical protein